MKHSRHLRAGFSMVELLVGMAITLILLAAAMGVFTDALHSNETVMLMADMDQNLRAGMNLLIRDFIQAGSGIPVGGIALPNGTGATPVNRPGLPGLTFTVSGTNWTSLPALSTGGGMGPRVPFVDAGGTVVPGPPTDLVNILYADNVLPLNNFPAYVSGNPSTTTISPSGSSITVDPGLPISGVNNPVIPGDLILFVNNQGTALQQVTSVVGQTVNFDVGDSFNLNQRGTAPAGTVAQLKVGGSWPPTTMWRIYMITYLLDTATNPVQPRLYRQTNYNPPNPPRAVGEVIENLQLSYDFLTSTGYQTNLKDPPVGSSGNEIRKVNLYLAARSGVPLGRPRRYLRNNMITQISLRGISFVNRYP